MSYLCISLQNKFHLDICIFGLVLWYLQKYFDYIFLIPDTLNAFGKVNLQSLLFYAFTPKNEFLIGKLLTKFMILNKTKKHS